MYTVPPADGNLLFRSSFPSNSKPISQPHGRKALSQAMLRPFHSLEHQCAAERRLKAEHSRGCSSKAGFLGQLRQLNFVQQRWGAWPTGPPSPKPASPEGDDGEDATERDRWSTLPGTAPPPYLCGTAIASKALPSCGAGSRDGLAKRGRCATTDGRLASANNHFGISQGGRRRRPVHLVSMLTEDDPALIDFSEEPEDPRVYLPAHRIGDVLPEAATQKKSASPAPSGKAEPRQRSPKVGSSKSAPSLHIAARRMPLRPIRNGALNVRANRPHHGGSRGAHSVKPMSRHLEERTHSLKAVDVHGRCCIQPAP
jgi:hypothetical protein